MGDATVDDFGIMLISKKTQKRKIDVEAEAKALLGELGV
jgi:hypothetical protein